MSKHGSEAYAHDVDQLLQEVEPLAAGELPSEITEDIDELVVAVLAHVRSIVDVPDLDAKADRESRFDLDELHRLVAALETATDIPDYTFGAGRSVSWPQQLAELSQTIAELDPVQTRAGPLETSLRIGLSLNNGFDDLMLCPPPTHPVRELVANALRPQLDRVGDDETASVWSAVLSEFSRDRIAGTGFPRELAPPSFFEVASATDMRDRIATHLSHVRPAMIREVIARGADRYPGGGPGIASVLAMRSRSDLDDLDRRILTLLARIHTAWGSAREREFLAALGLREGAWIARSGHFERWNRRPTSTLFGARREEARALRLAKRLLFYCDAFVDLEPPLERTLYAYKLGLEVAFQPKNARGKGRAVFDETHDLDELALQRHACRFLVERGVPCHGVSFGRNEIDLLTRQGAELYVVEAKLMKHDDDWRRLDAHLAQLQQYMTQQLRARGILLVYNRSRVAIESPLRWIHGRFWVLPINLCPETPSRTAKSVSVHQGKDKLIDIVPNVRAATASVRKRKKV